MAISTAPARRPSVFPAKARSRGAARQRSTHHAPPPNRNRVGAGWCGRTCHSRRPDLALLSWTREEARPGGPMPGVERIPVDEAGARRRTAARSTIPCLACSYTETGLRDEPGPRRSTGKTRLPHHPRHQKEVLISGAVRRRARSLYQPRHDGLLRTVRSSTTNVEVLVKQALVEASRAATSSRRRHDGRADRRHPLRARRPRPHRRADHWLCGDNMPRRFCGVPRGVGSSAALKGDSAPTRWTPPIPRGVHEVEADNRRRRRLRDGQAGMPLSGYCRVVKDGSASNVRIQVSGICDDHGRAGNGWLTARRPCLKAYWRSSVRGRTGC